MKYMEDMEAASGSLMEKPMQDLPQNAQEAQGREALPWFGFRLSETAATAAGFTMKYMEDMKAASSSLVEKPMQDLPQNAQEAQG